MKKIQAFTLIEMLVVITIIGILLSLLLVGYQGSRKSARDGKRKADLEQIRSALEMCRSDTGAYPATLPLSGGCANYLPLTPTDPLPGNLYPYTPAPGGGPYTTYTLCAYLEIGSGSVTGCGSCGTNPCNYKVINP